MKMTCITSSDYERFREQLAGLAKFDIQEFVELSDGSPMLLQLEQSFYVSGQKEYFR